LINARKDSLQDSVALQMELLELQLRADPRSTGFDDVQRALDLKAAFQDLTVEVSEYQEELEALQGLTAFASSFLSEVSLGQSSGVLDKLQAFEAERTAEIRDQLELLQGRFKLISREIELEKQRTTAIGGIRAGLQRQGDALRPGVLAEDATVQSINDVRSSLREAVAIAFDPNRNLDLGEGLKALGNQIGINVVTALLDGLITENLVGFFQGLFDIDGDVNIAAAQQTLETTTLSLAGAMELLEQTINSLTGAGAAGTATAAGASSGGYYGGPIGFAEGGAVPLSAPKLPKAPTGAHSADVIPAVLRRGEYVATPEMNKRVPGLFNELERIRRGVHTGMPNFAKLRSPLRGFAVGGAASGAVAPAGGFGRQGGTQVLPVLVTDERNLKRLHDNPQFAVGTQRRTNQAVFRSLGQTRVR